MSNQSEKQCECNVSDHLQNNRRYFVSSLFFGRLLTMTTISTAVDMKAMNKAQTTIALDQFQGEIPDWVELLPAGEEIQGKDGRIWRKSNPSRIISNFQHQYARANRIPIDIEHATEVMAPQGKTAPAAGWIEEMQVREDGSIWGRVNWNDVGKHYLTSQGYRFLSPMIVFDKQGEVHEIISAGLTNNPNLLLAALNRANEHLKNEPSNQQTTMNQLLLATALGLNPDAAESVILGEIEKLKKNNQTLQAQNQTLGNDLQLAKNQAQPTITGGICASCRL